MWNWKPEKRLLEDLFAAGEVVVSGRDAFQRLYDLPERVIPRGALDAPAPSEEEFRTRLCASRGAGPWRADRVRDRRALPVPRAGSKRCGRSSTRSSSRGSFGASRSRTAERRWSSPPMRGRGRGAVGRRAPLPLRQPRLGPRVPCSQSSASDHVIEVYKPEPQRVFGYYVLPFLYGDRLVGRLDLKSDRGRGRAPREGGPPRAEGATLGFTRYRARQGPRPARPRARSRYRREVRDEAEHKGDSKAVGLGARRCRDAEGVIEVSPKEGPPDRGARPAARRHPRHRRALHRSPARVPPDRPDLDRRAAPVPRPLQPPRPRTIATSSTGCSGRRGSWSSGTRSSGRSRICRS